jgi:hypothetical protein
MLAEWATLGCPTKTGQPWTKEEMWEAVARGPHQSALSPDALQHFATEAEQKVRMGQAKLVLWDDIKDNPPRQLKISPIAAIPHKSKAYRSILDLSFRLRLTSGGIRTSVNDTTEKTAPAGAIDQIGECLARIIHAFAGADEDAKIFMAKWDIKDGFWRMDCEAGEEWNFAYVLPQEAGKPTTLVVPTSLQMGWVESPPYFCAATETARDVIMDYANQPVGTLPAHKFERYTMGDEEYARLPDTDVSKKGFAYIVEVYVDDFMSLVIPVSRDQLRHVATAVMTGIHDVFPPDQDDGNDPISEKKLAKDEGRYSTQKTLLGFDFDGEAKTMWLEAAKRETLLTILKGWSRTGRRGTAGIPFKEFESVTAKLRHAFTCIPAGVGLLSPCNRVLKLRPNKVYLHKHLRILTAIEGCRSLLRESTREPTYCRELISGWPDYVGIVDASSFGVGGVIFGEVSACTPTIFRWQWPDDIRKSIITIDNPSGTITNNDLELAGLLMLWLGMEEVCGPLREKRVSLFNDNSPTIGWVSRLASRRSLVAEHLIQALALRLKTQRACPLTPIHIEGKRNTISDILSRSFGSTPAWHCDSDTALLTLFNDMFPLPNQSSWTVFHLNCKVVTRVTSALRMQHFALDDWRLLPKTGRHVGEIGARTSNLWGWIRTLLTHHSKPACDVSQDLQNGHEQVTTGEVDKFRVVQYLKQSQPLARRSRWPAMRTQPR